LNKFKRNEKSNKAKIRENKINSFCKEGERRDRREDSIIDV